MVTIGHASIDERGKISGGKSGDQTGREVFKRDYYSHSKGWYVLRAKDSKVAEKIAKCMEDACENDCIGYDQNQRNTLYNAVKNNGFKCDKKSLKTKVETDCSALVRVCLAYAGIKVGDFNTATEKKVILATGKFKEVSVTNLQRGDILVTKTKGHTAVVLTGKSTKKSLEQVAKDVINGKYGNGATRKAKLESEGYNYSEVQKKVNELLKK